MRPWHLLAAETREARWPVSRSPRAGMWSSTPESSEPLAFFAHTLLALIARLPWFGRNFAQVFFRMVGSELLTDPKHAPATRPVFELRGLVGYPALVMLG